MAALAARLAGCVADARDPASTSHSYADMIGARLFAIACGYEDCDDLDVLRFDPAFKLACGRLPESGRDLMSQPTLSRLENAPSWRELARMGLTMIDLFCDSFDTFTARAKFENLRLRRECRLLEVKRTNLGRKPTSALVI